MRATAAIRRKKTGRMAIEPPVKYAATETETEGDGRNIVIGQPARQKMQIGVDQGDGYVERMRNER